METEGRLQKYVQHSLTVYCSIYTSLHGFMQPDKGRAVGKLLNQSVRILQRNVLKEKTFKARGTVRDNDILFTFYEST